MVFLVFMFSFSTESVVAQMVEIPDMSPLPAEIQELVDDENGEFVGGGVDDQSFSFTVLRFQWMSFEKRAMIVFFILPHSDMNKESLFADVVDEKSLVAVSILRPTGQGRMQSEIWYNKPLLEFIFRELNKQRLDDSTPSPPQKPKGVTL